MVWTQTETKCKETGGGVLGVAVGLINCIFTYETDLVLQGLMGSLIATLSEAIGGYYWNIEQGLGIWDYSALPFSAVDGQVNLFFSIAWFLLSIFVVFLDDAIDYYYVKHDGQKPPYYKIFGYKIFQFKER